jgi:hypothetical protein
MYDLGYSHPRKYDCTWEVLGVAMMVRDYSGGEWWVVRDLLINSHVPNSLPSLPLDSNLYLFNHENAASMNKRRDENGWCIADLYPDLEY